MIQQGSAKLGRDRKFQVILPLRGKVITEKQNLKIFSKMKKLIQLFIQLVGVGNDFKLEDSNYNRVIMTDADTDGAHIQVLLLTFFFKYMRPLVQAGRVLLHSVIQIRKR